MVLTLSEDDILGLLLVDIRRTEEKTASVPKGLPAPVRGMKLRVFDEKATETAVKVDLHL